MARDVALCHKLPPVPANLVMILLKQRRSYLVIKIGKKTAKHSPGCAKIIDRSPHPETRVNLIKRETTKHGHTSRQPPKIPSEGTAMLDNTENIVDRVAIDILKHYMTFFFVLCPSDSFCGTFDVTCFSNICKNCIAPVSCNPR